MGNPPKEKKILRFEAYKEIKRRILFLDLRPGEKIFESEIAESLKASATPVREALLMLEGERLVEAHPRLGFVVKKLAIKEVDEYFAIRKVLELFAVPLILEHITDSEIRALRDNIKKAEKCTGKNDLRDIIRYETEFHEILYKATRSDVFFRTISGLVDKFQLIRAIAMMASGGPDESVEHHKKILAAIEEKDARALQSMIKQHLNRARDYYTESPLGAFLGTT
jgi:DNA-binding GntR family transcriptional regulator